MRKFKIAMMGLSFICMISSCINKMIYRSLGVLEDSISLKKASCNNKQIVFFPMHHIGRKKFYNDVSFKIDSLRKDGYIFFYEGVKFSRTTDSLSNDTLKRKARKVIGIDISSNIKRGGYIDTSKQTLLGSKSKLVKQYGLINQPGRMGIGLDSVKDIWCDVYLSDLMAAFERKFGKLYLDDCDFSTGLSEKYSCGKYKDKKRRQFMLADYRNEVITSNILNTPHSKIAIVYGAKHFDGILRDLQQQDSTWKIW